MKELTLKRVLNIIISALLIVLLLPVFALISLTILVIDQQNPFITIQGDPSYSLRFRTTSLRYPPGHIQDLLDTMDYSFMYKPIRDRRITGLGSVLLHFKLDGLPQLFTVLTGHLTIV